MKHQTIIPNNNETVLSDDDFIVSKTDIGSRLLYGNERFISISGYSESELLGQHHNILRHPDMPRIAFKTLYEYLESGREWFGYVKNLKRDGGYYWVFANISPDYDSNGKLIGYYSVRRRPRDGFKNIIEPLYKALRDAEKNENDNMTQSSQMVQDLLDRTKMGFREIMIKIQTGEINEL